MIVFIKKIIDGEKKDFFSFLVKKVLFFFSLFFSSVVFIKNFLYDRKLLKPKKVSPFVISIGNIVAGGTGKTPFTIYLAKKLMQDSNIAIASRGYKSKLENKISVIKKNDITTSEMIGDEPSEMRKKLKDIILLIGKDRKKTIDLAQDLNLDYVILDDGFQRRDLYKNIEVVLIDSKDPFGKNNSLPRGYLRESKKSLKRADYIVLNTTYNRDNLQSIENEINKYTDAEIIKIFYKPIGFFNHLDEKIEIKPKSKTVCFSGIANPDSFQKMISDLDIDILDFLKLPDHEKISYESLKSLFLKARELKADFIITTQKDMVKLNLKNLEIPICYLDFSIEELGSDAKLSLFIENIKRMNDNHYS